MKNSINVYSEIGKLKKVLLHRPGKELENLMPEYLERLLFDDIPYLDIAQQEHDAFAQILKDNGVEVVYLEDLVAQSLTSKDIRNELVNEFISEAGILNKYRKEAVINFFESLSDKEMIAKMQAGIRKTEINDYDKRNLIDHLDNEYPFIIDPMPNLYFTRDPFASIGNGISLHKMYTETRNRETLFAKYIFNYHPEHKDTSLWYNRTDQFNLEGGDILVFNKETIGVGISQRTHPNAIEKFAKQVLSEEGQFKRVLAFDIPKNRSFMHLDTVFTMVDHNKFTIHPNIQGNITVFSITSDGNGDLTIEETDGKLEDILKKFLNLDDVELIKCGGGSVIDAAREQWNDGSNTLALAPGEVIVYSRNYVTNRILQEHGVKIHVMPSSELSRGRGGPRCMSMPLVREDI